MDKDYRIESRKAWYRSMLNDATMPVDDLKFGCLLRIADSLEMMAKNHAQLQRDRDYYERRFKEEMAAARSLAHSNAALRGHMRRMKRRPK